MQGNPAFYAKHFPAGHTGACRYALLQGYFDLTRPVYFSTQTDIYHYPHEAPPKTPGALRRKKLSSLFWLRFCNAVGTRRVAFANRFLHGKELRLANQMRAARYVVDLVVVILGYGDRIG